MDQVTEQWYWAISLRDKIRTVIKDCLHVVFFSPFFTALNGVFFWVVQDQMEVFTHDNNALFNAVNGCGTHF